MLGLSIGLKLGGSAPKEPTTSAKLTSRLQLPSPVVTQKQNIGLGDLALPSCELPGISIQQVQEIDLGGFALPSIELPSPAVSSGQAGGFDPVQLFGNGEAGVYYDPSDLSTLFQDAAGTIPVTASGQPVGRISDKSGNNNHAIQATAAARPTYMTNGTLHWLEFDGVDDALATSSLDMTANDQLSLFTATTVSTVVTAIILEFGVSSNIAGGWYLATISTGPVYQFAGRGNKGASSPDWTDASFSAPDTSVLTVQQDINDGNPSTIRRNGALAGSSTTSDFGGGNYANRPLYIGSRAGSSLYFNGRLYGAIYRGLNSTTSEIDGAEQYLAAQSGVTL